MVPDAVRQGPLGLSVLLPARPPAKRPTQRHVIVYFKDDKVASFDRDNVPESAPQTPEQGAPIAKFPKI